MIIIKGSSKKSEVLYNLIKKEFLTNKVLVLDSIGAKWKDSDWAEVWQLDNVESYKNVIDYFENNYEAIKGYDWVAFYLNSNEESEKVFKDLDRKYTQNFIVTIQADNGITSKYFL